MGNWFSVVFGFRFSGSVTNNSIFPIQYIVQGPMLKIQKIKNSQQIKPTLKITISTQTFTISGLNRVKSSEFSAQYKKSVIQVQPGKTVSYGLNYLRPEYHAITVRYRKEKKGETIFKNIIEDLVPKCAKEATIIVDLGFNDNKDAKKLKISKEAQLKVNLCKEVINPKVVQLRNIQHKIQCIVQSPTLIQYSPQGESIRVMRNQSLMKQQVQQRNRRRHQLQNQIISQPKFVTQQQSYQIPYNQLQDKLFDMLQSDDPNKEVEIIVPE